MIYYKLAITVVLNLTMSLMMIVSLKDHKPTYYGNRVEKVIFEPMILKQVKENITAKNFIFLVRMISETLIISVIIIIISVVIMNFVMADYVNKKLHVFLDKNIRIAH